MKGRRPGRDDQDGLSFGAPVIMFSMRIYDFFSELPIFVIVYHLEFMIKRLLPLLLAVVMSSGCAVLAGLDWDYGHLTNAAGTAITAATMSDEQIDELCRQSVAYADSQTPAAGAVYQQRLLKVMNGVNAVDGKPLNFKVYNNKEVNACAYGDGSVRVNSGLMDLMDDDELFAVIGHELGHVAHKDSKKAMQRAYLSAAAQEAVYAAGGVGQMAVMLLGNVSDAYINAQFSQKQELKADDFGFEFSVANGRDPYGMYNSLNKLVSLSGSQQTSELSKRFSSHPDSQMRAERMKEKADAISKKQ